MALTSIADQKTPGRPIEITFAAETGLPSSNQELLLIGHAASSLAASSLYVVTQINNSGDPTAGTTEANSKFGAGSELAKMVIAAINANAGSSSLPAIKCVALASTDVDFGAADAALTAVARVKAEYVVSPYDGNSSTLRDKLKATMLLMSGAQRVDNNQFGSLGVVFNRSITDPSLLPKFDTQYLIGVQLKDTGTGANAPVKSIGEMAAAAAAKMAGNLAPFNPLDSVTIQNVAAPLIQTDWPTVGAGLESESALNQGWTPLYVKPNGEVAFVRTVTGRLSADGSGSPVVTAYYDVQDFNVLYLWRKTLWTRFSQPDFKQRKASATAAQDIKSEAIRLATAFEDQGMFQAVKDLAKEFVVQRGVSDRSRLDVLTPVNVIPGLHDIATNVRATTKFDVITV